MPGQGDRLGSDATAIQEALSETIFNDCVSPTKSEIAILAYQLWLDNGCPVGSEKADWFRAEAILKKLVARCQDLLRHPSAPGFDIHSASEMLAAFPWDGHWEIWESEWGCARWVWDSGQSRR